MFIGQAKSDRRTTRLRAGNLRIMIFKISSITDGASNTIPPGVTLNGSTRVSSVNPAQITLGVYQAL